ncbi:30S ribosomal protein S6 [Sporolactobacillus sp. THM7-4]|nr:30S ribosomal protein S6 [Sporolactobacillus sp. THM7-4]
MQKYEIMYILRPDLEEEQEKTVKEKIAAILTDNGAEINDVKEMGKRRLAYEINDFNTGVYTVLYVTAGSHAIDEFDRLVKINDDVIRFLVIRDERKPEEVK